MKRIPIAAILLGMYGCLVIGECLYPADDPAVKQKPFVVLNGRKLTKGDRFSFLTDCGFYRFMVKEPRPDLGMVVLEYPSTISGGSPTDLPPYRKKDTSYEDGLPLGTTCYVLNNCSAKNNQLCFTLRKKKNLLELSYVIKKPAHMAAVGPMQKVDSFFKSGLNKDKKESEKSVPEEKKTAPSNWFVY